MLIDTGTSFWYGLRGLMRIVDPHRVASWFRPPVDAKLGPNGLFGANGELSECLSRVLPHKAYTNRS